MSWTWVRVTYETRKISPSLSEAMKVVADMSRRDLARIAIVMCLLQFSRYRYE